MKPDRARSLVTRGAAALVVVGAVVAGSLFATAGAAPHRSPAKRTDLSVFSRHPRKVARLASASSLAPPSGALLAADFGHTEVYVQRNSADEDCVLHLTAGEGGGSICAPYPKVEATGEVGVGGGEATSSGALSSLRVTALVPDGVSSITITDRDGSSYQVPVTDNVVEHDDLNAAAVSYVLPGGQTETTDVAKIASQLPGEPGTSSSTSSGASQ